MSSEQNRSYGAKLMASPDGNVEPVVNEVAHYRANKDCTDIYEMPSDRRGSVKAHLHTNSDESLAVTYN